MSFYKMTIAGLERNLPICKVNDKLDSAELQTLFAIKEMKRDFTMLWTFLTQTNDIFTACSRICREFERPAYNNVDARVQAANRFKNELDLDNWQSGSGSDEQQAHRAAGNRARGYTCKASAPTFT